MLKQLSKSFISKLVVYTWLLSLTFMTACNKTSPETFSAKSLTGEELFTAVFFGIGDAAAHLTAHAERTEILNGIPQDQREQVISNVSDIVWQITKDDPSFFNNFKAKITSGNHQDVKMALQEGGVLVFEKMKVIYPELNVLTEKLGEDVKNESIMTDGKVDAAKVKGKMDEYKDIMENNMIASQRACSLALVCVIYFAVAVHNTAAVTVAVAVAAVAAFWMAVGWQPAGDGGLEFEILVDEIATLP